MSFAATQESSPLVPPLGKGEKVQYPDFAAPGEKREEIKSATLMTAEEKELLSSLNDQPTSRLLEVLNVYDRMENKAMVQAIAELIEKRSPNSPEVQRVRKSADDKEVVRKVDYIDRMADDVRKGLRVSDPDAVDAQARYLLQDRRAGEAAELLEGLRKTNFSKGSFPYLDTLASCYFDLKRWDDAITVWTLIKKDQRYGDTLRQRAQTQIEMIVLEKDVDKAREDTYANPDEAVRVAKVILEREPRQPAAIAFYTDSLHYAGHDNEALAFIKKVQSEWKGTTAFPYQRLLAHCEMNLKAWDRAREAFGAMVDDPIFDEAARRDASRSMELTDVARDGEAASFAAEQGDENEARRLIAQLNSKHPNDIEAAGFEATVIARLGEKDKALAMLQAKKRAWTGPKPFPLQDTIGSIYIERKEYDKARAAFSEILNDKRYDWDERRTALKGTKDVRKAELLDVAYTALRDRRPSRAELASKQLRNEFGSSVPEAAILDAEIMLNANKVVQAREALETIEKALPANKVFSAKTSLASAELRSGQWNRSIERYKEIIRRPLSVSPAELLQAKWEVREAIVIAKPGVNATMSYRKDEDGRIVRVESNYQSGWMGSWRAGVFAHFNDITLKNKADSDPKVRDTSFAEGGVTVQRTFGDMLAAEMLVGLSEDEPIYGARIGNFINPGLQWSAAFIGNARSQQSTLVEAAGARENRMVARLAGPLAGPWNIDISANAFWMNLDGKSIGNGYGADALLEYVLQTETPSRPEIGLGYVGHWQRFSSQIGKQNALFDGNVNQHGVQLEVRKAITDHLRANLMASTYYAFDESSVGYAFGGGLHYYLNDNTSLFAEIRYNSESASASAGPGGKSTGAFEATLGASVSF